MMKKIPMILMKAAALLLFAAVSLADGPPERVVRFIMADEQAAASPRAMTDKHADRPAPTPISVSGELAFSRRGGLTINGMEIRMDAQTSIFPNRQPDRLPSPSSFSGKHATVLGMRTSYGTIEARLVMIADKSLTNLTPPDPVQTWMLPSETGEPVGEVLDEAPR